MGRPRATELIVAFALVAVLGGGWLAWTRWSEPSGPPAFVGAAACAGCHAEQHSKWQGSHHARAMEPATAATVLGDFSAAPLVADGVTTSFAVREGRHLVTVAGADGAPTEHRVTHAFGFTPLQQYLVEAPGGRLQALRVAWDSRPQAQGGQRWFHLYPGQAIAPTDPLHWTGPNQNWNWMCADCHSTELRRRYDSATDSYASDWAEMNVACESCHGPSSRHAADPEERTPTWRARGTGAWQLASADAKTRTWNDGSRPDAELDACAGCHARRRALTDSPAPPAPFLDRYAPALLDEGLYHADGQILDEVYEYGSFLQSRMHRAGVICSDCHEPHSATLRAEGNALCASCHEPAAFDTPAHHHHVADGAGAQCADCHMPNRTYMVNDERRDHSIRVPRPDLSLRHGTPNACTACHADRDAKWAAAAVVEWYGPGRRAEPTFVAALDAGRRGTAEARAALTTLAADRTQPGIARATALTLIPSYLTRASFEVVVAAAGDTDPLVRRGAARAGAAAPPAVRARVLLPLLDDPFLAVRVVAARGVAGESERDIPPPRRPRFEQVLAEWVATERASAERPEAHLNLATLLAERGDLAAAERELGIALAREPGWAPALVNLADLKRAQGREAEVEPMLQLAIAGAPDAAEPVYALGLLRVRQGRKGEALGLLRRAAELSPQQTHYALVHAMAQRADGDAAGAERTLERAHALRPADHEVLLALIDLERSRGAQVEARAHAEQLVLLMPDDPGARALQQELLR